MSLSVNCLEFLMLDFNSNTSIIYGLNGMPVFCTKLLKIKNQPASISLSGTSINFTIFNLPRLSVGIDLDFSFN